MDELIELLETCNPEAAVYIEMNCFHQLTIEEVEQTGANEVSIKTNI
ncbi:MAG: hypothetical protein ACRC3Z_13190 [Phocaeicola sp.]